MGGCVRVSISKGKDGAFEQSRLQIQVSITEMFIPVCPTWTRSSTSEGPTIRTIFFSGLLGETLLKTRAKDYNSSETIEKAEKYAYPTETRNFHGTRNAPVISHLSINLIR